MIDFSTIQGRQIGPLELAQVRGLLTEHPDWSRYRLSRQLATLWDWRNPVGQLKDMAARTLLLKLAKRGWITLPACRRASPNRMRHKPRPTLAVPAPAVPITDALTELLPLTIRELSQEFHRAERALFEALLYRHHYLSHRSTVGENLQYLVRDATPLCFVTLVSRYYYPLTDADKHLQHVSDLGSVRVSTFINSTDLLELELGGGPTDYTASTQSDNRHVSVGPFAKLKLSEAVDVRARVGYVLYWFSASDVVIDAGNQSAVYSDITIRHHVTPQMSHELNFGQSLSADINSAPLQLYYIRYNTTLNIIRDWTLQPSLSYQTGTEINGGTQDLSIYGADLTVSHHFTEKLLGSLTYQWLLKESSLANNGYNQNRGILDLTYQF